VGFLLVTSASAIGGLRWSLTHLLLKNKEMGMDHPVSTLFWLAPIMGVTLSIIGIAVEDWYGMITSKFFDGIQQSMRTSLALVVPGFVAFNMNLCEFYIVQRAGVVPMSIAGIAKEITTFSVSHFVFGDELTLLNIIGLAITVCGIALYTYHNYRKSVDARDSLRDTHDKSNRGNSNYVPQVDSLELDERAQLTSAGGPTGEDGVYNDLEIYSPAINGHRNVLFDSESDELIGQTSGGPGSTHSQARMGISSERTS